MAMCLKKGSAVSCLGHSDQGDEMSASSPRASPKWSWTARFLLAQELSRLETQLETGNQVRANGYRMKQEVKWQLNHSGEQKVNLLAPLLLAMFAACLLRSCCRNTVPSREQRDASFGPPKGSKLNALQSTRLIQTL
jgi:hypothetical protein